MGIVKRLVQLAVVLALVLGAAQYTSRARTGTYPAAQQAPSVVSPAALSGAAQQAFAEKTGLTNADVVKELLWAALESVNVFREPERQHVVGSLVETAETASTITRYAVLDTLPLATRARFYVDMVAHALLHPHASFVDTNNVLIKRKYLQKYVHEYSADTWTRRLSKLGPVRWLAERLHVRPITPLQATAVNPQAAAAEHTILDTASNLSERLS